MSFIEYTVRDRIITGHTVNTLENKDFFCRVLDYEGRQKLAVAIAIDGTEESSLTRDEEFYNIIISNIPATDLPLWEEIYYSIINNYSFTFDPDGTYAVQINPNTYILKTSSYKPIRVGLDTYNLSLLLKKV